MQEPEEEKEKKNTWDIWNPIMLRFEPNGKVFTEAEKHESMNRWCDRMGLIFEKYRDELEKTKINIPLFTAKILARYGALKNSDIDYSEKRISTKFMDNGNNNEDLIYKTFDKIIHKQKHVEDYLKKQRAKYSQEMPH